MNSVPYTPLSLPESHTRREKIYDFLFTGFLRSTRANYLAAQLRKRGDLPEEVWGLNVPRCSLAEKIAGIIAEEIEWPNANFIPDDPMRLVLFRLNTEGLFWDHMELECIFFGMEEIVGRDLTEEEVKRIYDGTFGEAVDLLLDIQQNVFP